MMGKRKRATFHLEYSWRRSRILIGAAVSAVMVWRVMILPVLRYLERNTDWFSAGIFRSVGYYKLHVDYAGLLAILVLGALVFASAKTDPKYRGSSGQVLLAALFILVLNFVFNPFGGVRFAIVTALTLVPTVFLASCLVIRGIPKRRGRIVFWSGYSLLVLTSFGHYSDESIQAERLTDAMRHAVYRVYYSDFYAERAPEKHYAHTVQSLAAAPQLRELGDWQMQLSGHAQPWGQVLDGGASDDFLDYFSKVERLSGRGVGGMSLGEMLEKAQKEDGAERDLGLNGEFFTRELFRNMMIVGLSSLGVSKNAYIVTDQQIVRCLTRVKSSRENRQGVVVVGYRPVPDIRLEQTLSHCFDGQSVGRVEQKFPIEWLSSPCQPLHGFSNYSPDASDILLAFILRLWTAEGRDMREAARHLMVYSLGEADQEDLLIQLVTASKHYEAGDIEQGRAAIEQAISLLQDVVLEQMRGAETTNRDKLTFVESFFAAYQARKAGDETLAREHDAACLEHRARWYESDPQVGLLARTAGAVAILEREADAQLLIKVGLSGGNRTDEPKTWSEEGFWLRKVEHDRVLIEEASALFGTVLDSFVSTRNREAEFEEVRLMFASGTKKAFEVMSTDGIEVTRYFLGSKHNGWCRYQLVLKVGEPDADGMKVVKIHSLPRYCRVDDTLLGFDEGGELAERWDAAGLPFHAPVEVGRVPRWQEMSAAHQVQRSKGDERDALLRLFLDQLVAGALKEVESLNIDLHPGAEHLHGDHRAAMERMRLGGESVR